ncbi:MAG: PorT family protein [Crocinitomicaceae bacterium]|nr:PorT family protein [Crocinitomicaceae bacterium]
MCFQVYGQNQELRVGVAGGFNAYQFTNYGAASYKPDNSYFTYNEALPESGLIFRSYVFNGFSFGTIATFAVRKWTFNIEPQYSLYRSVYVFQNEYYSERVVGSHSIRIPLFFTWRFFKKANSLYLTAGFIGNVVQNRDFQAPGVQHTLGNEEIYNGGVDYGDDHFNGVLYNSGGHWDRFIGLGKTVNNLNVAIRALSRTNRSQERVLANMLRVEVNFSYHILSTTDLTSKRKIYYE